MPKPTSDGYDLVLSDEWMALYHHGELVIEGVSLTSFDVLEAVGVPVTIWDADLVWASEQANFPARFESVVLDGGYEIEEETGEATET